MSLAEQGVYKLSTVDQFLYRKHPFLFGFSKSSIQQIENTTLYFRVRSNFFGTFLAWRLHQDVETILKPF